MQSRTDVNVLTVAEALAACHYIPEARTQIFSILYKALNTENTELQQAAHECMKTVSTSFVLSVLVCVILVL